MAHIGHIIHSELKRQRRSPAWLALLIGCDRTNVYKIFRRESIDTKTLKRISKALEHNFFEDLAADFQEEATPLLPLPVSE